MIYLYILIFIISFSLLALSSKWLIGSLTSIAQFLGWREFVLSFFIMAFAGSLPNLFIGISSVLQGIPELSFGEIVGGNIVDLTIAVALAAIISKNGLTIKSRTVQGTAIFTLVVAILPMILIHDRLLSRIDGVILLLTFLIYISWLFSKQERFTRVFEESKPLNFRDILKNIGTLFGSLFLIILGAEGIIRSSRAFSEAFDVPVLLIGILVIGTGNALPEIFFGIQSARKGDDWMVLGGLMGAVISTSSLVLGIISLLHPIHIDNIGFSLLSVARFFLIISAIFFLLFIRTGNKITRKEGIFLLFIYIAFVVIQVLVAI
ncbi:MAG: sodium:calcium antiporter [Candidatus Pacebacteria bacterium]|nr:sodium:calcium antiporter [Candidatus Paceibacterota bacterium]